MEDFKIEAQQADFVIENQPVTITLRAQAGANGYLSMTIDQIGMMGGADDLRKLAEKHDVAEVVEILDTSDALGLKRFADYTEVERQAVAVLVTNMVLINGERYASAVEFEDVDEADFSNTDDTIDTRDIVARVEVLRSALETAGIDTADLDALESLDPQEVITDPDQRDAFDNIREEYLILAKMCADGANYGEEWRFGATLVRESYFTEFAEEECESVGYISKDFPSWIAIDWVKTANTMKGDYTETDFDGVTYLFRT